MQVNYDYSKLERHFNILVDLKYDMFKGIIEIIVIENIDSNHKYKITITGCIGFDCSILDTIIFDESEFNIIKLSFDNSNGKLFINAVDLEILAIASKISIAKI